MASTRHVGPIQPIARALDILCALNEQPYSTLQQLHVRTKLPKASLHRILESLRLQGFIERDRDRGICRLTSKVLALSSGFNERSHVTSAGAGILRAATRRIKWPLAIGTLDGTDIVVRYSTMPFSPCAVRTTTVNNRHKLIGTAMGSAYLAYCGREERRILLDLIASSDDALATKAGDADFVEQLVATVRRRGFGLREGGKRDDSATAAVPIMLGGHVAAVVSLTMFKRSLTPQALEKYVPILTEVSQSIAERLLEPSEQIETRRAPEASAGGRGSLQRA